MCDADCGWYLSTSSRKSASAAAEFVTTTCPMALELVADLGVELVLRGRRVA